MSDERENTTNRRFLRLVRNETDFEPKPTHISTDALPVSFFRTCRKNRAPNIVTMQKPYLLTAENAIKPMATGVTPDVAKPSGPNKKDVDGVAHQTKSMKRDAQPHTGKVMNNTLEIYTTHFGLYARPFSLLPDPDFLFWSPAHRRAYTMLEYGILTCAPITLITGEVGSGKTTLLQHLLKNLDTGLKVGLVSNAQGSRGELLRWVLMSLDQPTGPEADYVELFEQFQGYLVNEYARGNRVVIIFDEAQNLSRESLEELRMFTNINTNKDELLQLVLVGQPELRDIVRRHDMRQFAQRVAANFHLDAMDPKTVSAYIGHRLQKAGAAKNIFNRATCELIFNNTGGVPRLVNQLCDLSMVYAFTNNQRTVTVRTVQQVLDDGAFFGAGEFNMDIPPS